MLEKDAVKRLNLEIPIYLHCEIKARAAIRNINMTEYVIKILSEQVLKEKKYE